MKKIIVIFMLVIGIMGLTGCDNNDLVYSVTSVGNTTNEEYKEYIDLTYDEFAKKLDNNETFVVLVYKTSCSHCQSFEPKLNKLIETYNLEIYSINLDELSEKQLSIVTNKTFVSGTPTMVFFKEGKNQRNINLVGDKDEEEIISFLLKAEFLKEK